MQERVAVSDDLDRHSSESTRRATHSAGPYSDWFSVLVELTIGSFSGWELPAPHTLLSRWPRQTAFLDQAGILPQVSGHFVQGEAYSHPDVQLDCSELRKLGKRFFRANAISAGRRDDGDERARGTAQDLRGEPLMVSAISTRVFAS